MSYSHPVERSISSTPCPHCSCPIEVTSKRFGNLSGPGAILVRVQCTAINCGYWDSRWIEDPAASAR